MIEPGIEATRARGSQLQRYAVSAEEYEQLSARRRVTPMPSETIDFIRVKHDGRVSPQLLERRMQLKEGDPIDPQTLSTEANRLYGLQVFEKVGYQLLEEGDQLGVVFTATTKRWGPGFLRFGLSIEDDFEGSTAFNMATRLWWPGINSLGAEWRSDLRLGTDPLVATEFYQPLRTDSRIFIAPHISLGQRNLNLFDAGEAVAELRLTELSFGIDAGAELGTYGELRIGAYRGYSDASVKVGDPGIEDLKLDTGGLLASVKIDTRDDAQFARSGTQAELIWNLSRPSLGADRHYDTVAFNVDSAWSRGRHTLALGVQFGKSLDARSALHEHFSLGGFLRMSGLERGALSGPYSGLARLVYYRRVGNLTGGLLELPVYLGASLETGNVWESRDAISFESLRTNGSLFIGIDSYFGPIYLAAGFAEGGRNNFYLFVGAKPR